MMGESRTAEQLREHYVVEKELADKLRHASRQDRRHLYTEVNDEICRRVSNLPLVTRKTSPELTASAVARKMKLLGRFLRPENTFLEIGPGDCALCLEIAKQVKRVVAIDVCNEITSGLKSPPNFQLIISDGCSVPVPDNSIDVAYSNSLMEHLHPDDAFAQLQNVYNALVPGGVYVCVTPNRLTGPHDISRYFDKVATGLHLKEYSVSDLSRLLKKVGFSKTQVYAGGSGVYVKPPLILVRLFEILFGAIPYRVRTLLSDDPRIMALLGVRLVGTK
jgi:SAM-dependent methyltransferase